MGQFDVPLFYSVMYVFSQTIRQVLQLRKVLYD